MTDPFETLTLGEFTTPFDDVDGLAAFLLAPENNAWLFAGLRANIALIVEFAPPEATTIWSDGAAFLVRSMPEARALMSGLIEEEQRIVAWHVLDRAVELVRARQ